MKNNKILPWENSTKIEETETRNIWTTTESVKENTQDVLKIKDKNEKYNLLLKNYLNSGDSSEILTYFSKRSNLEIIDFIQNYLFKAEQTKTNTNNIIRVFKNILQDNNKQNLILWFLLADFARKDKNDKQRYEHNPINFLKTFCNPIKIDNQIYYQVSKKYFASFDFSENADWVCKKIGIIQNNTFYEKEVTKGKNSELILKLSYIPKIRKFIEEHLLIRMKDISITSQINLFEYFIESNNKEIDEYKRAIAENWDKHIQIQQELWSKTITKDHKNKIFSNL